MKSFQLNFYLLFLFISISFFACTNNTSINTSMQSPIVISKIPITISAHLFRIIHVGKPKIKRLENITNRKNIIDTDKPIIQPIFFFAEFIDTKNHLWLCSRDGLVCYHDSAYIYSRAQGLPDTNISCILPDKKGNIWLGTEDGRIIKYDGENFTIYDDLNIHDSLQAHWGTSIRCIYEDKDGNIWIGTNNRGIISFNQKTYTIYSTAQGLCDDCVNCIIQDHNYNFWVGTSKGVCRFDGNTFTTVSKNQGIIDRIYVWCIAEENNGNLLLGTHYGLWTYDGNKFTNISTNAGIPKYTQIVHMFIDREKNIWFNSIQGICKFDGKIFINYTPPCLEHNDIGGIVEDTNNNMWFGACFGELIKFDGKNFTAYQVL
ncbi:MAG: two-component regulator propeller domain-containing protein [Bacteroidia bacterium]